MFWAFVKLMAHHIMWFNKSNQARPDSKLFYKNKRPD